MKIKKKLFHKKLAWIDPEKVFTSLFSDKPNSFWLDSSLTNQSQRFSYMGIPEAIISYSLAKNTTSVQNNKTIKKYKQNIFDYLNRQLKENYVQTHTLPLPFIGGFVGYFGYELKALSGAKTNYISDYPDSVWFKIKNFIAFDHLEKKMYVVYLTENKIKAEEWFKKTEKIICHPEFISGSSNKKMLKQVQHDNKKSQFIPNRTRKQYLRDIETCKEYLEKGESYQICLTNQLTAEMDIDPLLLYRKLRSKNPAPYSAFIKHNDLAILCSSPEEFLKINNDGWVETKPIKGTIRRGMNRQEDILLQKELAESKKDWSENAMIVDLLRNDLGKVCEFGSVEVTKLMDIESYQTVHQLVSTVKGKLKKETSLIDCIQACFPGGSMTGAPKIQTMEILDSLEKNARGIYSGAIGFLSFNHTAQLNIVIRTIIMQKSKLTIGAGGAILTDSNPEKEYDEMLLKASVLMQTATSLYNPLMHTIFLGLGSNVGNKKQQITKAVKMLGEKIKNITTAKLLVTKPMYYEKQNDFLNTVISGETDLSPQELFIFVKQVEEELGRKKRFRNGPREIDVDILFYDDLIFESETLQIPHPKIQEREFVLKPLMDIAPDFVHPVLKKQIKQLNSVISTTS